MDVPSVLAGYVGKFHGKSKACLDHAALDLHGERAWIGSRFPDSRRLPTMKCVLLGMLSANWAERHGKRTDQATAKLAELRTKLESVHHT